MSWTWRKHHIRIPFRSAVPQSVIHFPNHKGVWIYAQWWKSPCWGRREVLMKYISIFFSIYRHRDCTIDWMFSLWKTMAQLCYLLCNQWLSGSPWSLEYCSWLVDNRASEWYLWTLDIWWLITVTSYWDRWRLKSPASPLVTQPFIQAQKNIKENIKAPRHWPLCGEFTGDRRIPRTNGQ